VHVACNFDRTVKTEALLGVTVTYIAKVVMSWNQYKKGNCYYRALTGSDNMACSLFSTVILMTKCP